MQLQDWLSYLWQQFAQFGYFGVFLVSLIGSSSIIIPIPYTILIFSLGLSKQWDPLLLTIACGSGAAIGELSSYLVGYYGRKIVSAEQQRKMNYIVKILGRSVPIAVFIFALTPLPDDLFFIPLGIMHYNLLKVFIPSLLGKLLMVYLLASFGQIGGDLIIRIYGEEGSWIGMLITFILLMVIVIALFRIDWEKVFGKYLGKRDKTKD